MARVRMDQSVPKHRRKERVDAVIKVRRMLFKTAIKTHHSTDISK